MISKERGFYTSLFKKTIDKNLEKDSEKLLDELKKLDPSKETINNFAISFANQIFKYRFYGLVLAIIPFTFLVIQTCLIGNQNNLIKRQNEKIEEQNIKIEKQVYLEEASRRNNLVLLMDNILEKVNDEIDKGNSILSKPLIGRISALSQGFQPYYFLEDSTNLTKRKYSPERGQFLLALANSSIDTTTMDDIYNKATFRSAYLRGAKLRGLYLRNVDLWRADLQRADLGCADLQGAHLIDVDLRRAHLWDADLQGAHLIDSDLQGAGLWDADLQGADLMDANLQGANLALADLQEADLVRTDLQGADLTDADLQKADLTDVKLSNAIVSDLDWLIKLKEFKVKGYEKMIENYVVVDCGGRTIFGDTLYRVYLKESVE